MYDIKVCINTLHSFVKTRTVVDDFVRDLVLLWGMRHKMHVNTACTFEGPSLQIQYSVVVMPTMQRLMMH